MKLENNIHFKIFIISFFCMLPIYVNIILFTPTSGDLYHYRLLLSAFSSQLWHGDLFPKWLYMHNDNLGSPAGIFYAPLAFYLGSLLEFLARWDSLGFFRVILLTHIFLILCAYSAMLWLKSEKFNQKQVDFGTIIHMVSPPMLSIAFTFNPASTLAIAILPLCLRYLKDTPKLALCLSAMLLSHPPTFIVFAPLIFAYGIYRSDSLGAFIQAALNITISYILAAFAAAFYLIPFYANLEYVNYEKFTSGQMSYIFNFFNYRVISSIFLVIFPIFTALATTYSRQYSQKMRFWYSIALFYFFLMMPISSIIWEYAPLLKNLQFQNRLLFGLIPIVTYILCYLLPYQKMVARTEPMFILIFISVTFLLSGQAVKKNMPLENEIYQKNIVIAPEYEVTNIIQKNSNYVDFTIKNSRLENIGFISGHGHFMDSNLSSRKIEFSVSSESEHAVVRIKRIFFPTYEAYIDGQAVQVEENDGLLSIKIPQGNHKIKITWEARFEKIGYMISMLSLVCLTLLSFRRRKKSPGF